MTDMNQNKYNTRSEADKLKKADEREQRKEEKQK